MNPQRKIGVARGQISIGLEQLQAQRRLVVREAQMMGRAIESSFKGSVGVVNSFSQSVSSASAKLREIQGELTTVTLAGAGLTMLGLRAADNLRLLEARFTAITGSQAEGLALMQRLEDAAVRFGQPIRETQATLAGVVNQLAEAGENVEDFVGIAARLRLVDPTAQAFDVQVALREAISGNFMSLQRRFEFPPASEIKELVAETGSLSEALDIILTRMGASAELAEEMGTSFRAASQNLQSTLTKTLEKAFLPQLENATIVLTSITSAINDLPDGFLEFAGSAVIATTAVTGLALGVSQLVGAYEKLIALGILGSSGLATRGIVGAGALALGANIGVNVTRGIGAAAGSERLQNSTLADAGNIAGGLLEQAVTIIGLLVKKVLPTLRQAVFLITHTLIEVGRGLAEVFTIIITSLSQIPRFFYIIGGQMQIGGGLLIEAVGRLIQYISDIVPGGGQNEVAQNLMASGQQLITVGEERVTNAQNAIDETFTSALEGIDLMFDEFVDQALNFAGVVTDEAKTAEGDMSRSLQQAERDTRQLLQNTAVRLENIAEIVKEKIAEIDSAIRFGTELNRLGREGTVEQVESRIAGLNDERQAIEALLPELEALAETNTEAADSLEGYKDKLSEIDSQINQLAQLTPELARKALTELGTEFAKQVKEIEDSRREALADVTSNLNEDLTDLDKDLARQFKDARKEEIEAVTEFQEEREDIEKEHQKRMLEIEQSGRESIFEAAGRLDAAGVRAAIKARDKQREEAQERLGEQTEQNSERLQDVRENLAEERQEILMNYNERRNDIIMAAQAERQVIQQRYQEQLNTATQAFNAEAQLLNQYTQQKLRMQSAAQQAEMSNKQAGYNAMVQGAQRFAGALSSIARGISTPSKSFGGSMTSSMGTKSSTSMTSMSNNNIRGSGSFGGSTTSMSSLLTNSLSAGKISRFADGGIANFAGNGEALAFIRNKERVLTPQQTSSFDKLISMLSEGTSASGGTGGNIDNITIDLTGVSSLEGAIETTVRQTLGMVLQRQIAGTSA